MLWVFATFGLGISIWVLYEVADIVRLRSRAWPLGLLGLFLLVAAWLVGHQTIAGWLALLAGGLVGVFLRFPSRAQDRTSSDGAIGATAAGEPLPEATAVGVGAQPASLPVAPHEGSIPPEASAAQVGSATASSFEPVATTGAQPHDRRRASSFTTRVLLRVPWEPTPDVFFASLRRGGLRGGELLQGPGEGGGSVHVRVGAITLKLKSEAESCLQSELDYAIGQTWDWPEAGTVAATHRAHVVITTWADPDTPRAEVVGLHYLAHAALAEFGPVVAVLWPDAGRLVPVAAYGDIHRHAEDPLPAETAFWVNFRMFPPGDPLAEPFVSDSVGLHAFGLPDIQICTRQEPDERVSAALCRLAQLVFAGGHHVEVEQVVELGDLGKWQAVRAKARFEPDREVISLSLPGPEGTAGAFDPTPLIKPAPSEPTSQAPSEESADSLSEPG